MVFCILIRGRYKGFRLYCVMKLENLGRIEEGDIKIRIYCIKIVFLIKSELYFRINIGK